MEAQRRGPSRLLSSSLRVTLKVVNLLLAAAGICMLGYAVYMYLDFRQINFNAGSSKTLQHGLFAMLQRIHRNSSPWFIYAFGGAGLFLCLTAISGLYGASYNSRHCLNFYSTMVVVMLLAQCALLVGYFADKSWKEKLPHDDTGEAARIEKFLSKEVSIMQWVALGAFLIQILSVMLACWLTAVQKAELDAAESEEEDEIWGRRRPLLREQSASSDALRAAEAAQAGPATGRSDPWSIRMREKYGLDTSQFTYNPEAGDTSTQPATGNGPRTDAANSRRCTIM